MGEMKLSEEFSRAEPFKENIRRTAEKFKIPVDLLFALIKVESDFTSTALRWEPGFYHKYVKSRSDVPFEEAIGWACSWGLMQLMGATARWMGYTADMSGLFQPIINLDKGCKYLSKLAKKYSGNWDHALAAYNAGSVRYKNENSNEYVNQNYVDRVNHWRKVYKESV